MEDNQTEIDEQMEDNEAESNDDEKEKQPFQKRSKRRRDSVGDNLGTVNTDMPDTNITIH